jgi:hypothetical protein
MSRQNLATVDLHPSRSNPMAHNIGQSPPEMQSWTCIEIGRLSQQRQSPSIDFAAYCRTGPNSAMSADQKKP